MVGNGGDDSSSDPGYDSEEEANLLAEVGGFVSGEKV